MAKKKYYQSSKDRKNESRGMTDHYRYMDSYNMDPRRRREYEDGMMIHEDLTAIANLPQQVKYHEWPKSPYAPKYNLNDTIVGIDVQVRADSGKEKKELFPEKY